MGLSCTHNAFDGAYSAFNRLRQAVAKAMGGSYPPHDDKKLDNTQWYWGNNYSNKTNPGLFIFLSHSDCDGEILPKDCQIVANELEMLLPEVEKMGLGGGHIEAQGGYGLVLKKFINGCREAFKKNESLEFN